jgi:hypothetical protein
MNPLTAEEERWLARYRRASGPGALAAIWLAMAVALVVLGVLGTKLERMQRWIDDRTMRAQQHLEQMETTTPLEAQLKRLALGQQHDFARLLGLMATFALVAIATPVFWHGMAGIAAIRTQRRVLKIIDRLLGRGAVGPE